MVDPLRTFGLDELSGRRLGKYEVVCRLSTGGMSEILLAFQQGLAGFQKYVVLKRILEDVRGEEDFVRMFVQEAQITAAYAHPHIAQVFDLDIADGELFLVMEFVPGATLVEIAKACLRANEPIPMGLTLGVVYDVSLALHYAHTFVDQSGRPRPVVHRDVSEKNIMVTYDGVTKLLDFGIARRLDRDSHTQVGLVKGTSGYMSPEQIRGDALDARSDVFSLGVVLHECLSGQRLFYRKAREEEMAATLNQPVPPPSRRNPDISPALDEVVLKALERNPAHRFSSAIELAEALERTGGFLMWDETERSVFVERLFATRLEQMHRLLRNLQAQQEEVSGVSLAHQALRSHAQGEEATDPLGVPTSFKRLTRDERMTQLFDVDDTDRGPSVPADTLADVPLPWVARWPPYLERRLPELRHVPPWVVAVSALAGGALVAFIGAVVLAL